MASGELGQDNIRQALKGFADLLAFDSDGMPEIARDGIENGRIPKFGCAPFCTPTFIDDDRSLQPRKVTDRPQPLESARSQ